MRKFLPLFALLLCLGGTAMAQYPVVSIQDIQTVSAPNLAACIEASPLVGDTVQVVGTLVQKPDSAALTDNNSFQFWIRNGYGDFSGLDIIGFFDPNLIGVTNLEEGDSIRLTGVVTEFGPGESEIIPLDNVPVTILGAGLSISPTVVNVGDLNDNSQVQQLVTGETWEGQYIEIQNVTVASVDPFSGGTRVSFTVVDGTGKKVNITDKFLAQRLPGGAPAGNFIAPNVGDTYGYIRGVVTHSPNGCMGGNGRGYEISPTRRSDYGANSTAPAIISVTRNHVTPTSAQPVTVSAQVTDNSNFVASASLYYAVGVGNTTYLNVPMTMTSGTNTNGTWTADIPAQADGAFVKYYVGATDDSSNSGYNRAVPSGQDPYFYTVRDNGTTIVDVQFVPSTFTSASSGYVGMDVTVDGVVTASAEASNLGFVFIQQESQLAWSGIMVTDNPSLASLTVGQKVRVTGTVRESFNFTRIEQISSVQVLGTGTITPLDQDPSTFATWSLATSEPYEGMLLNLKHPTLGQPLFVVDQNPDAPGNFAEWRVGKDVFTNTDGTRVLAGRVTNTTYSSLNVSYVNDPMWASTDGIMNVPVIQVFTGDVVNNITGVLAYTFGNFKLLPRNNADVNMITAVEGNVQATVKAFPNPVQSQFRLAYDFDGLQVGATATVYDLMGRPMQTIALDAVSGETLVDISNLAAGNYFVKVTAENNGLMEVVKIQKVQ
ncbi:MAG TPA: T9SS type A sorting domain-containing protein [Bacteroidia bacterium]|nr:T9SS type A sorting domain-containing protein [Bacteroidia bacterium]